jgi:hypothetical protein
VPIRHAVSLETVLLDTELPAPASISEITLDSFDDPGRLRAWNNTS